MQTSVIITSFNEPQSIGRAIEAILSPNKNLWDNMQLIIIAPDTPTLEAAKNKLNQFDEYKNVLILKDDGKGKPAALNMAMKHAIGETTIFTDGDMHIGSGAIKEILAIFESDQKQKIGGVSGHPLSTDSRSTMFGFFSHVFCAAADCMRTSTEYTPMSGYLYGIRSIDELLPLPEDIRAEDAYISGLMHTKGYKIAYAPNAKAYVSFPKNLNDWIKQKTRSLGGNVQIFRTLTANSPQTKPHSTRNIMQDIKMALFPLQYANGPREYLYATALYPLRLYLWMKIYLQHIQNTYSTGAWERIESSKSSN